MAEPTTTELAAWPDCAVRGCPNKCCLRLDSPYCWGHTPGLMEEEVLASLSAELRAEERDPAPQDDKPETR